MKTEIFETCRDDIFTEVEYSIYGGGKSADYDVPHDPLQVDIEKIYLHLEGRKFDITDVIEDIAISIDIDKIEEKLNTIY